MTKARAIAMAQDAIACYGSAQYFKGYRDGQQGYAWHRFRDELPDDSVDVVYLCFPGERPETELGEKNADEPWTDGLITECAYMQLADLKRLDVQWCYLPKPPETGE